MSASVDDVGLSGLNGSELMLISLSEKQRTIGKLTEAEILMGMTAATSQMSALFGPSPRDMKAPEVFMPESLKGALANVRI